MKITITHEECFLVVRSGDKAILCLTTESALCEVKKILDEYRKGIKQ